MKDEVINLKDIDSIIPVGQKIMVYIKNGNFQGTYSSYIYDIDKYIHILIPTNENGLKAVMRKKDEIDISFVAKNGDRLGFQSIVVGSTKEGSNIIYQIQKPKTIKKTELRNNFRVQVLIDAEFYYFKDGKIKKGTGTIIDISAGGARLSCEEELTVRDKISLKFALGEYLENIDAEVVRIALTGEDNIRHYGLRFINVSKDKEDKIIKFCISKQLETLRKMRGI